MGRSSGGGGRSSSGGSSTQQAFGTSDHNVVFDATEYARVTGVSVDEALDRFQAIQSFSEENYTEIRQSQRSGNDNKEAQQIEAYLKTAQKYEGDIHRGVALRSVDDFYRRYGGLGGEFRESSMNSWSSDRSIATGFSADVAGRPVQVIFTTRNKSGASIRNKSSAFEESEVLVGKGARYKVSNLSITQSGKNTVINAALDEI